ncbi:hypothetical protein [Micrococcus sp. TA1]|uniref:hypothetical protein n=1 Tax=Micrococcus sp. TA1 TaxID=681627 RepID=UPI00160B2AAD|nr:hypothetical protein [Micrococcus sp. TA1]MBB5748527.1 hypothetical protein [Micrococcus sp. TA1]
MTALITIEWQYPDGKTPLAAQQGSLYVEPMQGWVAGDALVNRVQTMHRVTGGLYVLSLPNDTARVWKIRNDPNGSHAWTDYKLVPAGEPDEPVAHAYRDLVSVDPATLAPAPDELVDVIASVAATTITDGAVVDGALILTRGDGTTINAGNVQGQDGTDATGPTITDNGTTVTIGA